MSNINLQWIYVLRKDAYYLIDTESCEFAAGPCNKQRAAILGEMNGMPFNVDDVKVIA